MQVDLQVIFGDSWRVLRKVLSSDIQRAMDAYWSRARREEGAGHLISPAAEVHAVLLLPPTKQSILLCDLRMGVQDICFALQHQHQGP